MNNTTYVQEESTKEIVSHLRDLLELDDDRRKMLDFDEHLKELLNRVTMGAILTKNKVRKVLNDLDQSSDEYLSVIDTEAFIKELFK